MLATQLFDLAMKKRIIVTLVLERTKKLARELASRGELSLSCRDGLHTAFKITVSREYWNQNVDDLTGKIYDVVDSKMGVTFSLTGLSVEDSGLIRWHLEREQFVVTGGTSITGISWMPVDWHG